MRCRRAITLVEVTVVCVILVVIVLMLAPSGHHGGHREIANRSKCGANLSGIYKAMYTYSVTEKDWFPVAGPTDEALSATGFREGDRATENAAMLTNNVTASLWMMVRDGSCGVGQFICPSSGGSNDPLTTTAGGATAAALEHTRDFLTADNLSFSPVNMYHVAAREQWGSGVFADYVLMGDANNNDSGSKRHSLSLADRASVDDIRRFENSPNHRNSEGQNFLKGDGSTTWAEDPFQGRDGDNIYAMTLNGRTGAPRLGLNDGDAAGNEAAAGRDVVLMPLRGNGGASLSGLPGPMNEASAGGGAGAGAGGWGGAIVFGVVFFVVVYGMDRWGARRGKI